MTHAAMVLLFASAIAQAEVPARDALSGTDLERLLRRDVATIHEHAPGERVLHTNGGFHDALLVQMTPEGPRVVCVSSREAAAAVLEKGKRQQ